MMSPSCISARKGEGRCRMEICNVPYFLQQSRHRSQSRHQIGERQHRPEIRWNQAACRESLQLCGPDGRHQRAAGCFQLALLQRCFRAPGLRHAKQYCNKTLSGKFAQPYASICDKYCPGGEMWGSESADAGGQGRIWASAYPDVLLAWNELGGFTTHMVSSPTICGRVRTGIPVHCDDWEWKTAGTGA